MDGLVTREPQTDLAALDTVLAVSRPMVAAAQRTVAEAFRQFAGAVGEVPDSQWPTVMPALEKERA